MAKAGTPGRLEIAETHARRVYRMLIEQLRSGELKPGTRLSEENVAQLAGVSRTPVREALTRLQARGIVVSSAGGLVVADLTRQQVNELYAMRAILEGAAARFAAENASAGDLAALRQAGKLFADRAGDATDFAKANRLFHDLIYEAAHNQFLDKMVEDLNDTLALLPRTTFLIEGRAAEAADEHSAILGAIEARDAAAAEEAARTHIHNAMESRIRLLFSAYERR